MDPISDDDLRQALEEASHDALKQDSFGLHHISRALRDRSRDTPDDPLHFLQAGLDYHFVAYEENREDQRPFGPMIEMGDSVYPMPLGKSPDDVLELWARAVELSPLAINGGQTGGQSRSPDTGRRLLHEQTHRHRQPAGRWEYRNIRHRSDRSSPPTRKQ